MVMNNDLREQVNILLDDMNEYCVSAEGIDAVITLIRNATLDEVKEAVELNRIGTNKDDHESDRYYDKAIDASIKAIDNLRGKE